MSDSFEQRLLAATRVQQEGRLDDAARLYRELRRERPHDARLLYYEGVLGVQRGDLDAARTALEAFSRLEPEHAEAHGLLGQVHRAAGRPREAEAAWRTLLELRPDDPRSWYEIGCCRLAAGDTPGASAPFERFLAGIGASAEGHFSVALAYHEAGHLALAARNYELALEQRANFHLARQNLAALHQQQGDLERAEQLYEQVLAGEPDNHEVLGNLGTLYKDRGDLQRALDYYSKATRLRHGVPEGDLAQVLQHDRQARLTSVHSLRLEAEQIEYLLGLGRLEDRYREQLASYREVIAELEREPATSHRRALSDAQFHKIGRTLHRLFHLGPTAQVPGGALNQAHDFDALARDYRANPPGLTVVDGFLTSGALEALRQYCLQTTFWFDYGKAGGYSGAYMQNGFGNDLILQLAGELRAALPEILGPHHLQQMWGYIYDSRMSGITMHADKAAVNLNFWLTPDAANLDPASGGLVVYTREAPAEWDFKAYNSRPEELEAFVRDSDKMVVPYRCNRLVMFHSNLVHKTDDFHFKPGLENRRINVTMLFGERPGG